MNRPTTALVTPSYAVDYDRCRLLCDSMDQYVSGHEHHYILVDDEDYAVFAGLNGTKRTVVNERDILPDWLRVAKSGFHSNARKLWYSFRTWPMRGWHVQQLRRIAIAHQVDVDGLLYCDSDMLFVRPFDVNNLWHGEDLRLYCVTGGITQGMDEHQRWCDNSAKLLGLPRPVLPANDYINNLVSWRRLAVIAMCERIEAERGCHWLAAIGHFRAFSECQIYGAHVMEAGIARGHWLSEEALCRTYWNGAALNTTSLREFAEGLEPNQVAIGIQSFTNTDTGLLRDLFERAA